jgi:hypothetical protein
MITIKLKGGLGNQLFQWALGVSLAEQGKYVQYDPTSIGGGRRYHLPDVGVNPKLGRHHAAQYDEPSLRFDPDVKRYPDIVLNGFWQSEQYFSDVQDKIRKTVFTGPMAAFSQNAIGLTEKIHGITESISVHVRRTDYVNLQHYHGLMGLDYYDQAMRIVGAVRGAQFFIFSDDIEWCKQQTVFRGATFVEGTTHAEDLFLLSRCKHAVIANSTFSWWGAYLSRHQEPSGRARICIAPKRWFTNDLYATDITIPENGYLNSVDIVPEMWVRI